MFSLQRKMPQQSARAARAAAMNASKLTPCVAILAGHATEAARAEVGVARLYAAEAAQILVARFLPLGYQIGVGNLLLEAVVVQLLTDCLALVEEIVDVAALLMMNAKDWPERLDAPLALVRLDLHLAHLLIEILER